MNAAMVIINAALLYIAALIKHSTLQAAEMFSYRGEHEAFTKVQCTISMK